MRWERWEEDEFGIESVDIKSLYYPGKYSSGDVKLAPGNTIMLLRINARGKDISLAITTIW